jgi:hypothetical protein
MIESTTVEGELKLATRRGSNQPCDAHTAFGRRFARAVVSCSRVRQPLLAECGDELRAHRGLAWHAAHHAAEFRHAKYHLREQE